jgi:hypothetical protein
VTRWSFDSEVAARNGNILPTEEMVTVSLATAHLAEVISSAETMPPIR